MWWAAENWTHYICHEPSGYHIEIWPFPKARYHYESCFHLTLWQMHVEMHYTSSIYLHYWSVWQQHMAYTDTFSPWSRICCNIYSYKWMQFRPFSWFVCFFANSEMSMQTELVGKTWRNLAFPLSSLTLELQILFDPQPLEQIQTAGLLDLSHKFPNQQRNHATIQQLKCMCLILPANPPVALPVQEAIPQPVLLHLKSIATQHYHHFKLFQTLVYWFFPSSMSLWQHSSGTQWNCKNSASLLICKLTRLHTDFQQKIPFDDKSTCFIKQRNYWRHTSIYWHSHIIFFLSCFSIITNDHNSKIVVWWYAEKLFQHNKHPRWCASQL